MEKELSYRENDGIAVTLLWHTRTDKLTVTVRDWRTGEAFELAAEAKNAMDVFNHPYAYAARFMDEPAVSAEAVHA